MKTALVTIVLVVGCGDDSANPGMQPDAGTPDTLMIDGSDHGHPSDAFPAVAPNVAQVTDLGGPVYSSMVIVTVTWTGDPHAADFENFGDVLGGTNYWHTINSEYGIGPA